MKDEEEEIGCYQARITGMAKYGEGGMRGYQALVTGMVKDGEEGMRGYQALVTGMVRDDEEGMMGLSGRDNRDSEIR